MASFIYPISFVDATTIQAADFNTNFNEVRNFVINSAAQNVVHIDTAQTVTGNKIHSGTVTLNGVVTLGANLTRAADQVVDLTGAATRTFTIQNSTASQVTNFDVDGQIIFRNGHATGTFTFGGTPTAARVITFQDSSDTVVGRATTDILQNKTLRLPQIDDTSADHQYVFAVSELTLDRNVTLPLLTADDTFVFAAFAQTLSGKTLTQPTIADFVNAGHNHQNAAGGGTLANAALADRTRSIWLDASAGQATEGAPTQGQQNSFATTWDYDAAVAEAVAWSAMIPSDCTAASSLTLEIWWTKASASGDVKWQIEWNSMTSAENISSFTVSPAAQTAPVNNFTLTLSVALTGTTANADELFALELRRDAAHAADTLTVDARLLGLRLSYTADM